MQEAQNDGNNDIQGTVTYSMNKMMIPNEVVEPAAMYLFDLTVGGGATWETESEVVKAIYISRARDIIHKAVPYIRKQERIYLIDKLWEESGPGVQDRHVLMNFADSLEFYDMQEDTECLF